VFCVSCVKVFGQLCYLVCFVFRVLRRLVSCVIWCVLCFVC